MIRRLINFFSRKRNQSSAESYREKGNVIIGMNSDISKLYIHIFGAEKGIVNVEIGNDCMLEGNIYLYTKKSKIKIGNGVYLGSGSSFYVYEEIEVGDDVMISWGCTIIDTNAHSLNSVERKNDVFNWKKGWQHKDWSVVESKKVIISSKSWIGFNSIILKGTQIGEGCIVGAGSVVAKSFDAFSMVGGNPAKFIKSSL